MTKTKIPSIAFADQINDDQKKYSRYVCDSRAIPNSVDGMKPVQRRILWTMWNSVAKNQFTKTVKVAGLTMGYHPHGDASIQDALSAMAQDFTFANNYPFVKGEGTFGDVLDSKAIASPRYTEVKIHDFAKDVGLFESIPDIDYVDNYDETTKEPVYFIPKIPVVLLNNSVGIATGFRCNIPGYYIGDIVDAMINVLKKKKIEDLTPWYKDFKGYQSYGKNDKGQDVFTTGFGFEKRSQQFFLTHAPQGFNREKTIEYIEQVIHIDDKIKDYADNSTSFYDIEIIAKKGISINLDYLKKKFDKCNNEILAINVITEEGRLRSTDIPTIIKNFVLTRKTHLIKRFKRLALLEQEKIQKNSELIRFIDEKWNQKVTKIKNKKDFEAKLKKSKFIYYEWLSNIPVYRMTEQEVEKCKEAILLSKKELTRLNELIEKDRKLNQFIINEINELKDKWG